MDRVANGLFLLVLSLGLSLQADAFQMEPGFISLETVTVGNPDNPADSTGFGAVAYPFKIGKFEVTAAQYTEFLNAKAKKDPYGLYDDNILESEWGFKLERQGEEGAYSYSVDPEYANRPIVKVTFWDACRFCNWLHNGQGDGDTETGAYTLNGRMDDDNGTIRRNPSAKWFLPSEDEWYKAAYYDPKKPDGAGYWDYPTRSDSAPNRDFSGSNSANLNIGSLLSPVTTAVGSFANSGSAYGTFDQGGNVSEWTESVGFLGNRPNRCLRGGAFILGDEDLMASSRNDAPPTQSHRLVGFRVAGTVTDGSGKMVAALGAGVSSTPAGKADLWASPRELRTKKMIGTGQYSLQAVSNKVTPRFLAEHPDFISSHPFDGVTLVVPLDPNWLISQDMAGMAGSELDFLAWSKISVPYTAIQNVVQDLNRIKWGSLTDNFLWVRMLNAHRHKPDVNYAADFAKDDEWAVVEKNAALMARICRETNLKGFMLDTEQYSNYASGQAYPMGKDVPALLRKRGAQWIQAVQAEYPGITIMVFFSWSPDVIEAGFLAGIKPFLDGVLDEIKEPARLIHGHENTFYFGHAPGTKYVLEGLSGGRDRYQGTRESMKKWRILSSSPEKYDNFVKFGMAAWVESDPWDIESASGSKYTVWSNLPLALAYSDEYVWVWSEYTNYGKSFVSGNEPNPFLLSVSNQTFNTGHEAVASLTEDFKINPLLRGWYFDFDMLDVGRKKDPSHEVPVFSADAVPYVWSKDDRTVRIQGTWMTGPNGDKVAKLGQQRRRYVHPLLALHKTDIFQATLDFQVEKFSTDPDNPILLGLFNSDELVSHQALTLQIKSSNDVCITLVGDSQPWVSRLDVKGGLKTGGSYQIAFAYDGLRKYFQARLTAVADSSIVAQVAGAVPESVGPFQWDEIGVAQWDASDTATPMDRAYAYHLQSVSLKREPERWASPHELRGKKFIGGGLYTTTGGENTITPRFLATHPEFVDSYPFDGIVVPAVLSPEWVASLGLTKRLPGGKIPWQPGFLHYLMWNTVRIPDEAVAQTISDLKAMYRGHLTDNFLICGMIEGTRGRYLPDFSQDADWAILEHNARLAARVCREGKLKGFWLDTEQYTQYRWPNPTEAPGSPEFDPEKPQDQGFPLGRDTAEVLRHRGTQWIKAVQAEFPEVKIMTTFAWSEDSQSYGPLIGAIPFLDGILEGMESAGRNNPWP